MVFQDITQQAPPALLTLDAYLKMPHKRIEILSGLVKVKQNYLREYFHNA